MKIEIEKLIAELELQKSKSKDMQLKKERRGFSSALGYGGKVIAFDFCIKELKQILKNSSKRMLADEGGCPHSKTHMSNGFITCSNSKCKKRFY